jgi:hypothetical protein
LSRSKLETYRIQTVSVFKVNPGGVPDMLAVSVFKVDPGDVPEVHAVSVFDPGDSGTTELPIYRST